MKVAEGAVMLLVVRLEPNRVVKDPFAPTRLHELRFEANAWVKDALAPVRLHADRLDANSD